jgi:hypothetical protein
MNPTGFEPVLNVHARPNMARYLASPPRIAFNKEGIFRHYSELDARTAQCPASSLPMSAARRHNVRS